VPDRVPGLFKTHRGIGRPDFEQVALVLQGGGALGAYQAGVFQALEEAEIGIDWIAGVSIGAVNAALVAGSEKTSRLRNLRRFWSDVSSSCPGPGLAGTLLPALTSAEDVRVALNHLSALTTTLVGAKSLMQPRLPPPWLMPRGADGATSFYSAKPLKDALERYVDFERINAGAIRLSLGAVNVTTGNFVYFDSRSHRITSDHVLASAALPPTFAAVDIEGEAYWDGGVVSNTPLDWVAESEPRRDTLVFQVDLWNTRGQRPTDLAEVLTRLKEIQFASRTRASTTSFRRLQRLRNLTAEFLAGLPPDQKCSPLARKLASEVEQKAFRIVQCIYHARPHQGSTKDFEFSELNASEHWQAGYNDAVRTLRHPEATARPDFNGAGGVGTFDIAVNSRL